jgi:UDP-glucuronate 4-epimerase
MKTIVITGVAGFVGFHLAKALLKKKIRVIGIDNINNYYSIKLKKKRLSFLEK